MKKALKVTFGTMLAMSMIGQANAHFIPQHPENFIAVWVEGTYTKPSNNGLSVGDLLFANPNLFDGGHRHTFLAPDNQWDYALGFSYRLPCQNTRLFFHYDHYDADDSKGDIDIRNLSFAPPPQTQEVATINEHSNEFRFGAIHDLHFGDYFSLDLLAFLEYDKLRLTLNETISQAGIIGARETENKVRGFGPGVGFMTRWYAHNPHWHIFAGATTAILAADNDYHQTFLTSAVPPGFYNYDPEESDSLVGKLDINFGINYRCAFRHYFCGAIWDISLGMRYMNIFNAIKNGNTVYNPNAFDDAGTPINFSPNLGFPQDWGRWGPFLKFKIGGKDS